MAIEHLEAKRDQLQTQINIINSEIADQQKINLDAKAEAGKNDPASMFFTGGPTEFGYPIDRDCAP